MFCIQKYINRFLKLSHCWTQQLTCNKNMPPHSKCVTILPCEIQKVV